MYRIYLNKEYIGELVDTHAHNLAHDACDSVGAVVTLVPWCDQCGDNCRDLPTFTYYRNSLGVQVWEDDSLPYHNWPEAPTFSQGERRVHDHAHRNHRSATSYNMGDSSESGWGTRAWAKRLGRRAERRMGKMLTRYERDAA